MDPRMAALHTLGAQRSRPHAGRALPAWHLSPLHPELSKAALVSKAASRARPIFLHASSPSTCKLKAPRLKAPQCFGKISLQCVLPSEGRDVRP